MKKIVIALFAAVAMTLGSGALVSGATAAESEYPGSVVTKPSTPVVKIVVPGKNFSLTIRIGAGNSKVGGKIKIIFNGKKYTVKVVNGVAKFKIKAPKVKAAEKQLKYTFKPYTGSVYKSSKGSTKVKFKK
jgi:hypothetical protein